MKVFVTGADGMLGSNTVRELLKRGYEVKVFLQKRRNVNTLDGLNVDRSYGSILSADDLNAEMKGCEIAIHIAANTTIWPSRAKIIRDVNIEGTRNCIEAALLNKIKKLIYIGTANSFGYGTIEEPGDEKSPFKAGKYGLDYIDSKYESHKMVLEYVNTKQLPALIINPTFMLGPYDSKPGAGAMLLAIHSEKVPGYVEGGRNFVYVKDVAVAICNAIEKGKIGESYIAGAHNYSYKEAFEVMANTMGVKAPKCKIPGWSSVLYGRVCESISFITRKKPTVTCKAARIAQVYQFYSSAKAVQELNMPQTELSHAIKEAYEWFVENGYIKKTSSKK